VLALLFPGQGSQSVGMGRDVYRASDAARAVFDTADRALGFDLSRLCFEGPEEELRRTQVQQPAILTASVALLRALQSSGPVEATYVGGHSLGEYTALVAAGALDFEAAVRTVSARGRYMQEAVAEGEGAMAALLGCSPEVAETACRQAAAETGELVAPANYNAPQQTVIAGDEHGVERACELAREAGARKTVPLAVSAPFHCALMEPAAEKLGGDLAALDVRNPSPPVVSNVEAEPNAEGARVASLLEKQVTAPVRFTEMVDRMRSLGVTHYLEIGPGRVLSGLLARIERRCRRANLASCEDLQAAREFVAEAVGA